jgi:ribosomal protein S18 acetylase RimI-like enzyme
VTKIHTPDAELLVRAVRTFMNRDADVSYLESPATLVFTALTDNELTGWCWGYQLPRPEGSSMLYLHQLEVREPHRSEGIGRALLTAFMSTGKASGATKMFLTTGAENTAARALYDSVGGVSLRRGRL